MFEVGPCESAYQMGFLIGQRFPNPIRSRLARDLILQDQLLPFAQTPQAQPLLKALTDNNKKKFPSYWDELIGTAEGSGVPVLHIILINFRKEIVPFLPKNKLISNADSPDDCLMFSSLVIPWPRYLIKGMLSKELSFIAYTYAGELPSCAFGFNSHGLRIHSSEVSVGHSHNLIEIRTRKILNVETASRNRISVSVQQVQDDNSISRQRRALVLPKTSKNEFLSLLGDMANAKYPIYMTGPILYTLCTAVIDLDEQTFSIIEGNPKKGEASHVFTMSSKEFKIPQLEELIS
nr:hypothetical protein CFP56_32632 [Quercus suber]